MTEQRKDESTSKSPWDDLRRMADEVKVKLHLAGMEAKERWRALEPKLNEVSQKAEAKGERVADVVGEQLSNVTKALRQFADFLDKDLAIRGEKPKAADAPPADAPPADAPKPPDTAS